MQGNCPKLSFKGLKVIFKIPSLIMYNMCSSRHRSCLTFSFQLFYLIWCFIFVVTLKHGVTVSITTETQQKTEDFSSPKKTLGLAPPDTSKPSTYMWMRPGKCEGSPLNLSGPLYSGHGQNCSSGEGS